MCRQKIYIQLKLFFHKSNVFLSLGKTKCFLFHTGTQEVSWPVVISCVESINHVWETVWSQIVLANASFFSACMDAHRPKGNPSFCPSLCVWDANMAFFCNSQQIHSSYYHFSLFCL